MASRDTSYDEKTSAALCSQRKLMCHRKCTPEAVMNTANLLC